MFMSNFPQELVDHIIDQLYDDRPSLKSCSRVCRTWLPASRFHLFAKVSLKAASLHGPASFPSACCKRLLSIIDQTPEIASCIRELEVCEGTPFHFNHPEVEATAWATTDQALLALFKRLKNLRRLDFASTCIFYWKSLPATFQNAFCSLLATSTSLTYLRLHSWCFPSFTSLALLLSHCKYLKGLSLSSTTVNQDDDIEQRLRCVIEEADGCDMVHSANLEVLTLDFVTFGYLSSWLFSEPSTVDVSCLRELRVAHFPDISVIERLLVSVGPSLEHLHLKPGGWNVQPLDLSRNTGLRSLRLTLEEPDTAMDWVTTFLSNIKGTTVLERIGLEFYVDVRRLDGWKTVDTLLAQTELAASLRQVEIGLFASPSNCDFVRTEQELRGVKGRVELRLYQLGLKSQRSNRQLTPRISRYEG
ncbi:hypothetical protein DFP72DRAFT_974579 [Ephemerocybe angulata]|uniref:F-box domain-containing protein n=1 Tax=Ephemerocybe angulata TaxID=980116 RepID=A0A8H6HER9_9AGAR|nr:hypothetical protein DFP72DRAFT_974579 [Tulosesus angulatus]